jgi:molybdopterin-containing oxidoreductase family membrane subunit
MSKKPVIGLMGIFDDPKVCAETIRALRKSGKDAKSMETFSPIPDHHIQNALREKVSPLGYATLIGAIVGLVSGFSLAAFTSLKWGLVVYGKPLLAWIPWLVVGFEFTILIGCLTNFITMLIMSGLPRRALKPWYDERFSVDHYGVFVSGDKIEFDSLKQILEENGAQEVHEHA